MLEVIEPATERVLAEVPQAGAEEADAAVARAKVAFEVKNVYYATDES